MHFNITSRENSSFSSVLVWTDGNAAKTGLKTQIELCVCGLTKTETFENTLAWTGPKAMSV